MNPLVKKEIRLLLPGFLIGAALTFANFFLTADQRGFNAFVSVVSILSCSAIAMFLALNSFGAEMSAGTFPMLLAQPVPRQRIWRTKTWLLAAALFIGGCLWCAILYLRFEVLEHPKGLGHFRDIFLGTWLFLLVIYSGALWAVLLLRQMAAAFWCTLAMPVAIMITLAVLWPEKYPDACEPAVIAALLIYSLTGLWFARRLFLRAQDVAWTGGDISLPDWRIFTVRSGNAVSTRNEKPIFALLKKEFQLHQVTFIGMGGLFLLHFGVVALRYVHRNPEDYFWTNLDEGLGFFGGLWLVVPLLIGCASVAEERKFGTMESQLCLPVSRRAQFVIKFFFTLLLGGGLSVTLFHLAEKIGVAMGVKSLFFISNETFGQSVVGILMAVVALPVMAFYASTLTRDILHALAAALATAVGFVIIMAAANIVAVGRPTVLFRVVLWRGSLVDYIAIPALLAALVWLAWRNFKSLHENRRLWRRNILGLTAAVVFSAMLTTAIYHRVWELLTPLEPAHGAARLAVSQSPAIQINNNNRLALTILFPDGKLWVSRVIYRSEHRGDRMRPVSLDGNHFVGGSNWADAATSYRAIVGIQSDGSLWLAETERGPIILTRNQPLVPNQKPMEMTRFGRETNWRRVLGPGAFPLLLKEDGTLWQWGTNHVNGFDYGQNDWQDKWPGLHVFLPCRLGTESNWAGMFFAGYEAPFLRQNDGRVWRLLWRTPNDQTNSYEIEPGVWLERVPGYDGSDETQWQNFYTDERPIQVGIRTNGTLWTRDLLPWTSNLPQTFGKPVQIGSKTDWKAVAGRWYALLAVQTDGSLWKWDAESQPDKLSWKRLGNHSDWVAVKNFQGGVMALAADGGLWYWQTSPLYLDHGRHLPPFMLAAPRKPALIGNIFDKADWGCSGGL
jgi:ABC-type transport system involved in multi-copper enzyme maturation permease subunit